MADTSTPWYQYPRVDQYGTPDPYGGFPKPDSNIQVPDGYPITALLPGTVSGINSPGGSVPDWGAVITIKLDTPLNQLATHTAYLHLKSLAPGLSVGSHVSAGQLVGYSGGSQAAGSQKVPVGFALYNGDYYGYGNAWSQIGNPLLDMTSLLNQAASGQLSIPGAGAGGVAGLAGASIDTLIPGLSQIFSWFSSMQGLWDWLQNPTRLIKLLTGIGLVMASILLLISPEAEKVASKAKFLLL